MKKIIITIITSFFFLSFLNAQETLSTRKERREARWKEEQVFSAKSLGVSLQNQQNTVVSPLIYSGIGLTLSGERQRFLANTLKIGSRRIQYNMLSAENSPNKTHSAAAQFGFDYLKQLKNKKQFWIGGNVQINSNIRFYSHLGNNAFQYEIFPTIGISSVYKTDFQLFGKKIALDASLKLPIIGALMAAPKYTTSFDELKIKVVPLGKMVNPQTSVFINLPANKRFPNRQHRIGYEWNMNSFGRGNDRRMTMATHTLCFIATLDKIK